MSDPEEQSTHPRFTPGSKDRVKYGVTDPDFPDIPLGGWTGIVRSVEERDDQVIYDIEWDRRTLDAMHPIYRKRCERDGLDPMSMRLDQDDIEPDDSTHVPIEQPTNIVTPPLSEKDQDDRVRMALGLTHDDPLPDVSDETLLAYCRYLEARLRFPFNAFTDAEEVGPSSRKPSTMTVTGLLDPEREPPTSEDGLICTGQIGDEETEFPLSEIEVKKKNPNARLVSDYAYWFNNWPSESDSDDGWESSGASVPSIVTTAGRWGFGKLVLVCGIAAGIQGDGDRSGLPDSPGCQAGGDDHRSPALCGRGAASGALRDHLRCSEPGPSRLVARSSPRAGRRRALRDTCRTDDRLAPLEPTGCGSWCLRGTISAGEGRATVGIVSRCSTGALRRNPPQGIPARRKPGHGRWHLGTDRRGGRGSGATPGLDRCVASVAREEATFHFSGRRNG